MPSYVRAEGGVRVAFAATGRGTRALTVAESGGYRLRFPRAEGSACEAVLINTGGGMAGGDRMNVAAELGEGADALLTTQAAEKVYRSDGPDTAVAVTLDLAAASRLAWLPQETILFDRARFSRRLDVRMAADATLTLAESIVFGRLAMGEVVADAAFADRWRIGRGGALVFAEDVRLSGDVAARLDRPAVGKGARALATVLHVAPGAEARLDEARAALEGSACEAGASAWNGLLLVRLLSPDAHALRRALVSFLERFRGRPMPRSW
ncbi:urease accessory protein UreD [Chelatococcus sp. SYSU_G07232]|uniref:Urease accessory protein UreD n=1 Tax=Chelatococcus albus TaxID=3047466 RepID=A0ABT7AHZ8_9HYPH|nr:urease accessory protein UreD [Chelatococcus sp. SYSU_G07232]